MGRKEGEVSLPCHELHFFCLLLCSKTTEFALGPFPGCAMWGSPGCDGAAGLLERSLIPHKWLGHFWAGLSQPSPLCHCTQQPSETVLQKGVRLLQKRSIDLPADQWLFEAAAQASSLLCLCIHVLIRCLILQPTAVVSSPDWWQGLRCLQKELGVPKCN